MLRCMQILRVNCDEMDGDRPGQSANSNCYRLFRVSYALAQIFFCLASEQQVGCNIVRTENNVVVCGLREVELDVSP